MQANTISQTPNFRLVLISFVVVTIILLTNALAVQILPAFTDLLPYLRQELSNLVAETLYIR